MFQVLIVYTVFFLNNLLTSKPIGDMFQDWESGSGDIPIILSTIFVYIQVHEASSKRKNITFWYSILPVFNPQTAFFYCFGPKLCLK